VAQYNLGCNQQNQGCNHYNLGWSEPNLGLAHSSQGLAQPRLAGLVTTLGFKGKISKIDNFREVLKHFTVAYPTLAAIGYI
jgi:hypothetical protein